VNCRSEFTSEEKLVCKQGPFPLYFLSNDCCYLKPNKTNTIIMSVYTMEALTQTLASGHQDQRTYTFVQDESSWYIDLPAYLKAGGRKEDLRMKAGTDRLLKMVSSGKKQVTLTLDTEPFEGADVLELIDLCAAPKGGGIYLVERCKGEEVNILIWICDIALFVFGDLPQFMYIKPVNCPVALQQQENANTRCSHQKEVSWQIER
jgi:hypothetical protein